MIESGRKGVGFGPFLHTSLLNTVDRFRIGYHIANANNAPLAARAHDDVFKLFDGVQTPQRIDRVLEALALGRFKFGQQILLFVNCGHTTHIVGSTNF